MAEAHRIWRGEIRAGAPTVLGEAPQLRKVVGNLLSNALKFTPDGGEVTVSLDYGATDLTVRVSDTGIGIQPKEQERVFERFYGREYQPPLRRHRVGIGAGQGDCGSAWGDGGGAERGGTRERFFLYLPIAASEGSRL